MSLRALPFHGPAAASTFAGLLGAGIIDALLLVSRAGAQAAPGALTLAVAIYGSAGLVSALLVGWAIGVLLRAVPGGPRRLLVDPELDLRVGTGVVCALLAMIVIALGEAIVFAGFTSKLYNRTLATIAQGGLTLALAPAAALVALAALRPARGLVGLLPRPGALGRSGLLVVIVALLGLVAAIFAVSRADWRAIDFGWLKALTFALLLGGAHALFWYGMDLGKRLHARLPIAPLRTVMVALVIGAWMWGARLPESAPAFGAIAEESLGLRPGLAMARRLTDADGDGFSARFGGGDCDEARTDSYPGAEEIPGDGIDQNCEGGDAKATTTITPTESGAAAAPKPAEPLRRRDGAAFDGNILIISVDALRADRLGVAGYKRRGGKSLTPTIDTLANRGAYFRRAWSHAPNTPRSFPAFITSRYPSEIEWQKRTLNYSPILPSNETFFDLLGRAGLRPLGIFSHFYFAAERGLNKGFTEWSNEGAGTIAESNKDIASPRIVPKVIARLEKAAAAKERFVLWTHLFEPHSSYIAHKEFPTSLRGVEGLEEKYDFEIAYVDRWIGKIVEALERTGLAQSTAVVIVADHGEAWGEHKHYFHGQDLTEEQLRVPLIVAVPGRQPVVVDDPVALVDVGPTLLDLVGVEPPAVFRGRSLLPLVEGKTLPARPVFAELLPASAWPKHEVMMVDGQKKITHKITDRRWELHDLGSDPKQQRDVSNDPKHKATFEALRARLLEFEEGKR